MRKPEQITIPTPCHENWQDMKPMSNGRFCDSCQKKVHDFTASPDKVILEAFAKDSRLCGRFRVDQLDRELIVPKEKSTIWTAASAAVISFLTLGNYSSQAQEAVPTEQHEGGKALSKYTPMRVKNIITGVVSDEVGPLPGAGVKNNNSGQIVSADIDGAFTIEAVIGDTLEVFYAGFEMQKHNISNSKPLNITLLETGLLQPVDIQVYRKSTRVTTGAVTCVSVNIARKRTFVGRIFHRIGNLFR